MATLPADCAEPANSAESAWCRGAIPDRRAERPAIDAAVARMEALGGACRQLAQLLRAMLAHERVRLFAPDDSLDVAAIAPIGGGATSYLLLSRLLVAGHPDAAHLSGNVDSRGIPRPETLQFVLAHEADHLRGAGHIDPDGYLTPEALRCSDLAYR